MPPACSAVKPASVRVAIWPRRSVGQASPLDPAALLQPGHGVREPAARGQRARRPVRSSAARGPRPRTAAPGSRSRRAACRRRAAAAGRARRTAPSSTRGRHARRAARPRSATRAAMVQEYIVECSTKSGMTRDRLERMCDMAIHRLNHAVLYVRDVARSVAFYRDVLGFEVVTEVGGRAAFLRADGSANDHDLGLFEVGRRRGAVAGRARRGRAVPPGVGGRHPRATSSGWPAPSPRPARWSARPTTAPRSRCTATTRTAWSSRSPGSCRPTVSTTPRSPAATSIRPLDLRREIDRYGADTPGGVGVSRPATRLSEVLRLAPSAAGVRPGHPRH